MSAQMELDETLCKRPVCQHPQCWVTVRRIEQGNPRYRPLGSVTRLPSRDEGGLPVLSVTTLPSSQTSPNEHQLQQLSVSSMLYLRRVSSPTMYKLYNSAATCSMEKVLFPGVSSYREIIDLHRRSVPDSSPRKPRKVEIADPCFQDAKSRNMTMVWVPNSQQRSPTKEDKYVCEKPLKVQIKDLTLTDVTGGRRGGNRDPAQPISRRKKKPPTGGCPHNLTLAHSSPSVYTKTWMTASSVKEHPEEMVRSRRRLYDHCPDMDSLPSPALDGPLLENRRAVLHHTREKRQHSPAVPHTGPVYRMDEQQFASLNDMKIDLDSIKNQYYLWKKYIGIAGPSHRIKPPDHRADKGQTSHKLRAPGQLGYIGLFPYDLDSALSYHKRRDSETPGGSVVCDTARSYDSESRDSPSLAGFSQSSWTDGEPCKTPTEMEAREEKQPEIPGEGAAELTGDRDIAQIPPDLEQEDLPEEEESTKPNISPGPPESTVWSLETADVQEIPERRVSFPRPNPPPPSPML